MKFYKISEVAEMFGVSPQAVTKWIKNGKIKAIKNEGMATRISKEEIEKITKGE